MVTQLACATRKHEMVDKSGCPRTLGNGYPVMLGNEIHDKSGCPYWQPIAQYLYKKNK